jgi:alanine dehydrogenase
VFEDVDTRTDAVTLHLGGDETPADHIRRVLRTGLLVCDDVAMVSRRNSQSLALYFSRMGATLEQLGPMLGVMNLKDVGSIAEGRGADPVHVTCVGLPMLDLYVAAYVYETFLQDLSGGESAAHLPMAEIAERA